MSAFAKTVKTVSVPLASPAPRLKPGVNERSIAAHLTAIIVWSNFRLHSPSFYKRRNPLIDVKHEAL
jgi:hypothetical protein